jgi:Domain of unknown function (DUF6265)
MQSKHFTWIALIFILISFTSCTNSLRDDAPQTSIQNYSDIKKAGWLIGSWQNVSENEISAEIWEKKNDSTFSAKSYVIVKNDTVFSESIRIEQRGNSLFYIPTVKEQNQGHAVEFVLVSSNEDQLVFENLKHDFPQKISYNKITNDSILAEISGIVEGKNKTVRFPFTRRK